MRSLCNMCRVLTAFTCNCTCNCTVHTCWQFYVIKRLLEQRDIVKFDAKTLTGIFNDTAQKLAEMRHLCAELKEELQGGSLDSERILSLVLFNMHTIVRKQYCANCQI